MTPPDMVWYCILIVFIIAVVGFFIACWACRRIDYILDRILEALEKKERENTIRRPPGNVYETRCPRGGASS